MRRCKLKKKKAFFAAPFETYLNPETGVIEDKRKEFIDELVSFLESKGYDVHNAHQRENYGKDWMEPDECTPIDFEKIIDSELLVAVPGNPASGGVHIEIGWASALSKYSVIDTKIILLLKEDGIYSNLVQGLGTVGKVNYVHYNTLNDCKSKLEPLL